MDVSECHQNIFAKNIEYIACCVHIGTFKLAYEY